MYIYIYIQRERERDLHIHINSSLLLMKKSFRPSPLIWTWKSMRQNSGSFSTNLTKIAGGIERHYKIRPVYFKHVQIIQVFAGPALGIISYWAIPSCLWSHTLLYTCIYTYTCFSSWKICFTTQSLWRMITPNHRKNTSSFTLGPMSDWKLLLLP